MYCRYGCGKKGIHQLQKSGLWSCSTNPMKCSVNAKKMVTSRRITGYEHTESTKGKISKSHIGLKQSLETRLKRSQKLKGRKRPIQIIKKITESNHKYWLKHKRPAPWNKGKKGFQIPWNKGLRKQEPIAILERNDPIYSNFRKYRNRVAVRTKKNYEANKEKINPNNLKLGKAGIKGAHHVDHIISVRKGFEKAVSVEEISKPENLQILTWLDNIKKYDGKKERKHGK
jgi:hypothetical protein